MSIFFNKQILTELGVKGGPSLEDEDENKDTPEDTNDDGPQDPPEDNNIDDGPEDSPEDNNIDDGPQDLPEDTDEIPDDNDGPQDPPEENNTDDGPSDPPKDNDDGPTDPLEDEDNSDDGPQDPNKSDDESTDDGDMDDFDDSKEQTLSDIEDSIFSSLTPEQKGIKVAELKGSFVEVYKASDDIIEKINLIPKDNSNIEVFERLVNTLIDLKTYVQYYISKTFDTKSYLENEVVLQKYTTILNQVKEVFKETSKRK